ncbi:MAG: bifunctional diaminohydroxyphosphoribosylaminopyrimidine deaminase/5-amino-6-(5-phosphoribosylamino)uracil reductase RibD [Planctomycetota bacterium]
MYVRARRHYEPCCHQGKTPPCTRALIDAGVERVVISHPDPFEKVDGGGLIELRNAGLQVEVGVLRLESASVLAPYLKRVTRGIPWVIGKWAMTIDGRVATRDGQSQWITGTEAREDVHQVRGRMDAVVTGMGTVRSDDPLLTARPSGVRVANRVVVCRQDLPGDDRQLVATARKVPTILAHPIALSAPAKRLSDRWATRSLPVAWDPQSESKEYLLEILRRLSEMGATNVVLECGPTLMGQFFDHDLIDEFHVYVGASAFGGLHAMGPVGGVGAATMQQARSLHPIHSEPLGCDFKMVYRRDRDTAAPIP